MVRASGSYPEGHKFESHRRYQTIHDLFVLYSAETRGKWPVGQAVKTPPFHGGNMGSSPVRVTTKRTGKMPVLFVVCFRRMNPSGSENACVFFERSESPRTGMWMSSSFRTTTNILAMSHTFYSNCKCLQFCLFYVIIENSLNK